MKKITTLLLIGALSLSLLACGKSEKSDNTNTQTSTGTTSDAILKDKSAVSDMDSLMNEIWLIHEGSAGCSIRAEETASTLSEFATNYGNSYTKEDICVLAKAWLDAPNIEGEPFDMAEFKENLLSAEEAAYMENENLKEDSGFQNVINGIKDAVK